MRRAIQVVLIAAMALMPALPVLAAPFTNGSFELGTGAPGSFTTLYNGSNVLAGWTIGGNSIDWIGSYWAAADGARSIDLNGFGPGSVSQTFDTVDGLTYDVRFMMAGNSDGLPTVKSLVADAGGNSTKFEFTATGSNANMGWVEKGFTFTANGSSTTLAFISDTIAPDFGSTYNGNPFGPALDDVKVTPVPEPGTLMLFGSGLAGLTAFRRKRSRN